MDAEFIAVDAQFRLFGHLDLGDQIADGRIRSGEFDAGGFADQAASAVAPDEIFRAQRLAVGQRDVDAAVVLRETCHLDSAMDRTASSPTHSARMRSIWFCHSPSP